MTVLRKVKSCPKPVANFESNLESLKSYKWFPSKKYQSDNHTNNQQKCIDCLKPRSNKNEHECKKCGCNSAITFMYLIIKVFHLQ